jgi:serine/threonine protein kinase
MSGTDVTVARIGARLGTTIGDSWRLDALIGVGGWAEVYAATHKSGRRAAFKVLHAELALDPDVRARFIREVELARRIAHPACVVVEGASKTDDGIPLLVMELLEGETLEARCARRGRLAPREAFVLADQLLDFLAACHAAGIVHRDLKPSNVFFTRDGATKVLDLGIARDATHARTARRVALGTPLFMAPEQARPRPGGLDGRADLFSLGAMLFSMLSGRKLRRASSPEAMLGVASREAPSPIALLVEGLPDEAARIVDRALAFEPSERYPDAATMRAAVRAVLERLPEDAPCAAPDAPTRHDEDGGRPTWPETPSARLRAETLSATVDLLVRPTSD